MDKLDGLAAKFGAAAAMAYDEGVRTAWFKGIDTMGVAVWSFAHFDVQHHQECFWAPSALQHQTSTRSPCKITLPTLVCPSITSISMPGSWRDTGHKGLMPGVNSAGAELAQANLGTPRLLPRTRRLARSSSIGIHARNQSARPRHAVRARDSGHKDCEGVKRHMQTRNERVATQQTNARKQTQPEMEMRHFCDCNRPDNTLAPSLIFSISPRDSTCLPCAHDSELHHETHLATMGITLGPTACALHQQSSRL
eukprot:COSAG02_NODE_4119_length_5750_cov_1.948151_7_plen_253_part_00